MFASNQGFVFYPEGNTERLGGRAEVDEEKGKRPGPKGERIA